MRLSNAIEDFLSDWRAQGRLTSDDSERTYRKHLTVHAEDVSNRDPRYTNRSDVKRTLRRYTNPNTQAHRRAILVSFYDWCMEEGLRQDNPARQVPRPRKKQAAVYRLTREEARQVLLAARTRRERRVVFLLMCVGLRNKELRGLQGRHFERRGFIWVPPEIAKGGRERFVPIIADLEPVVAEIQEQCAPDDYVVPSRRVFLNFDRRVTQEDPDRPCSEQSVRRIVAQVGERAGIAKRIYPHLLRHAYGDHIAKYAGMKVAQYLMGHAEVSTTQIYTGTPTLDELVVALQGFSFVETQANTRSRVEPEQLASRMDALLSGNPSSP